MSLLTFHSTEPYQPFGTSASPLCFRRDGRTLWLAVLAAWRHFEEWLGAAVPLMSLLAECVSAERAAEVMQRGVQDTPTLGQLGRIAFRSQVRGLILDESHIWQANSLTITPCPHIANQHSRLTRQDDCLVCELLHF